MGAKFCNLNLRGASRESLRELPAGYRAFPWDNGWTTLTSPALQWGQTQDLAKALSAALGCPVLATEYFDDDYVEFSVYRDGKRAARHVPVGYENLQPSRGSPEKFLTALDLNGTDSPRLRKIFRVEDPEGAVHLLESLLGCPIFGVDEDAPPDGIPGPEAARAFAGTESPVRAAVTKRRVPKDRPPYAFTLERGPEAAGIFDTVFCYTAHPKGVTDRLKTILRNAERDLARERTPSPSFQKDVEELRELRVLREENRVVLWGLPIVNVDIDLPDLSGEFRCLVAVCRVTVSNEGRRRMEVRGEEMVLTEDPGPTAELQCGLAYGRKLLCFGRRGDPQYNRIMPEISLESPWLTLLPGELAKAFETPGFWDAVEAVGKLLGHPIYPGPSRLEGLCIKDIP